MKTQVIESKDPSLDQFFQQKIDEFNIAHWEIKEKKPLYIKMADDQGNVLAGASAKTFGLWLLIDNLWVSEDLRGQNIGSKVLESLESAAIQRGCQFALLDTLGFQARPFYEKYGYSVQWTQEKYPQDGCKYFMTKKLV